MGIEMSLDVSVLEKAWDEIRQGGNKASGAYILEKSLFQGELELSAAVRNSDGMPGLIVRVPLGTDLSRWSPQRLSGVHFEAVCQERSQLLLPVFLADPDGIAIFSVFAADLAKALESKGALSSRRNRMLDRIDLWIRFFRHRQTSLSEDEVRGLVGELTVFESIALNYGFDSALEAWKGPAGELHDFHLENFRIEVKAWSNQSSPRIHISDPSQTIVDNEWPIWLAAVELTDSKSSGQTLPDRIASLKSRMTNGQGIVFHAMLANVGYIGSTAGQYRKRYWVIETAYYHVQEGFPTIAFRSLPTGIGNVKYTLELNAITKYLKPSPVESVDA